jgi:hypothetical protein
MPQKIKKRAAIVRKLIHRLKKIKRPTTISNIAKFRFCRSMPHLLKQYNLDEDIKDRKAIPAEIDRMA